MRTTALCVLLALSVPALAQRTKPSPKPEIQYPSWSTSASDATPTMTSNDARSSDTTADDLTQFPDRHVGTHTIAGVRVYYCERKPNQELGALYMISLHDDRTRSGIPTADTPGANLGLYVMSQSLGDFTVRNYKRLADYQASVVVNIWRREGKTDAFPEYVGRVDSIEWFDEKGNMIAEAR